MEDSFEIRVKKLFGSQLFETVPRSSFPASSWSVADGEVERREWNRERGAGPDRSEDPCSSAFNEGGCFWNKRKSSERGSMVGFQRDLDDLDEDKDMEGRREEGQNGEGDEEELDSEIRSSIGLDPTLDNEDEEDEYDRAALGREDAGERLYMRDVKDHGLHLSKHSIFEDGLEDISVIPSPFYKDPRADHFAASVRLKEDEKAFESFAVPIDRKYEQPPTSDFQLKVSEEEGINLKPILKRKEALVDSKPKKKVRFDPGCKDDHEKILKEAQCNPVSQCMETTTAVAPDLSMVEESLGVPDYTRNPTKYTHYTFDSYDDDDVANKHAFDDFRSILNKSNMQQLEKDVAMELPMSLTFIPRKKLVDAMPVDSELRNGRQYSVNKESQESDVLNQSMSIAACESSEVNACEMDEDDHETHRADARVSSVRIGRHYRSRSLSDD